MPLRCPTVKIVNPAAPDGWVVINESDREPHHKLWTGEAPAPPYAVPLTDELLKDLHGVIMPVVSLDGLKDLADPIRAMGTAEVSRGTGGRGGEAVYPATDIAGEDDFGPDDASLRVSKGPRGKFYVKNGKEHVHGPFETEDEALGAMVGTLDTP
jgi:hypothetical protein